jgi:hypothetical protein
MSMKVVSVAPGRWGALEQEWVPPTFGKPVWLPPPRPYLGEIGEIKEGAVDNIMPTVRNCTHRTVVPTVHTMQVLSARGVKRVERHSEYAI